LVNQKIIMIGPVYPFKGGIAHYTSLLFEHLKRNHTVKLISYKRQYPGFLYPGSAQKDYRNKIFQVAEVEYLLDTINPVSWIVTALKIKSYDPALIICQWWNPFFSPAYLIIISLIKLLTKAKSLFICHNVLPHEKMPLDITLTKFIMRRVDCHIVQSLEDEKKLRHIKPDAEIRITPHPTYSAFKNDDLTKDEARTKLGISKHKKVLLYFGFIREYKGLIYLLEAMPAVINEFPDIKLLVAGEFFQNKDGYLNIIEKFNLHGHVEISDRYIPDEEVALYFSAADLVVLPYTSATQSGIVQIAYAFLKPVIVTRVGGLPDVVEDGKTGYLIDPKNSQQIADSIIKFYKGNNEDIFAANISNMEERFSWDKLVETIEDLCL
jgi:glycosyltransferase involved in cell wall biosynthesis